MSITEDKCNGLKYIIAFPSRVASIFDVTDQDHILFDGIYLLLIVF